MIVTVLRSGGEYLPEHVYRLAAQCRRYAPQTPFMCLTDAPIVFGSGVTRIPLENGWPGWWSKIEAFRVRGPVLYMDLDTTIVGDLAPLLNVAASTDFVALRDFNPHAREMGSGLMAWRGDMGDLYAAFSRDPQGHMSRCTTPRYWGDQGFVEPLTPGRRYWQDLVPGAVFSFKKHCQAGVPSGARVICYHGKPRPWEVER